MKKRLVTILSLIMAFVLCFALVACGGNDDKSSGGGKKPEPSDSGKTVSISLNDARAAINGALSAAGFTGTASYTVSTKNTEALTESVSLDKRGSKLKMTSAANETETIVDFQTGYVYSKGENGYTFKNSFYANEFNYAQYLLANFDQESDKEIEARYDEKAKTVTFVVEQADSYNKYLAPLQNAYKNGKNIGNLLDDYCRLLFGKSFDAMYGVIEEYVKDGDNTVGTLLAVLKEKGVDVEAILETMGYSLPEAQMNAVKARPLNKVVVGAYNFIMASFGDLLPLSEEVAEEVDSDTEFDGDGMKALGMGLINAMLFDEISDDEVAAGLLGIKMLVVLAKNFDVNTTIDMALDGNEKAADLYTVIKDGIKLKNATVTVTFTVDDNKRIFGVKVDGLVSHTYTGIAAKGSLLADNDYRATAEIVIDEYKTPTEDFVINFDPECDYKMPVMALVYNVTDKDVSVYYETAGKTVNVSIEAYFLDTPDGNHTQIFPTVDDACKFDAATSSFVFDGEFVKSLFSDEALCSELNAGSDVYGTSLMALVVFDDDEVGYGIRLTYVNDDPQAMYDYARETAMDKIMGFIGGAGAGAPNIGEQA